MCGRFGPRKNARKSRRQILVSTHSACLLSDRSLAPEEVLLVRPTGEDSVVTVASDSAEVRALLEGGVPMGEAVLPRVAPTHSEQLLLKLAP